MYSLDDLLHVLNSDGAEELRLRVGEPPIFVLDGEHSPVEWQALTADDLEELLQSMTTTRQRRELRERHVVRFVCRCRERADFVVEARVEKGGRCNRRSLMGGVN